MDKVPSTHYISRTEKDDEDLHDVLDLLKEDDYSIWNADALETFKTPFDQTAIKWPSSDSGELNGLIPLDRFRSWLRLVLLARLPPTGDVRWRQELEVVTDSVLECFGTTGGEQKGVSWPKFDRILTEALVRILSYFQLKLI